MTDSRLKANVLVRVLAAGPKVRGIKPGRGDGFLKATKICSTPSFEAEVKPSAPCREILWHVKESCLVWKNTLRKLNSHFLRKVPPDFLPDGSAARIAKEFWRTNQEFSPVYIIPPRFSIITHHLGMNNRPNGGRSSLPVHHHHQVKTIWHALIIWCFNGAFQT
jgi:hypothetical protein